MLIGCLDSFLDSTPPDEIYGLAVCRRLSSDAHSVVRLTIKHSSLRIRIFHYCSMAKQQAPLTSRTVEDQHGGSKQTLNDEH